MCQLNLYIVPKSVKKEYVLNVMKDCFCYQNPECVTHENLLPEIQDLNEIYVSAAMGCNCGTVQTSYQNESGEKLWVDVKRRIVEEKIEKLKKIKILLEREDYLEYKNAVLEKSNELENRMKKAQGSEYKELMEEWRKHFSENNLLFDAMMRYEKHKNVNGKDVVCNSIDEEIANIENVEFKSVESDYDDLIKFVDAILEESDEVKLLSFWQDENSPFIKNEKYVFRRDLKIDDIVFLKENELLTIFRD